MKQDDFILKAYLKSDESLIQRSVNSVAAIGIIWLSIPSVFLFYYLFTLPARIKKLVVNEVTDVVAEAVIGEGSVVPADFGLFDFEIPTIVKILVAIPIILLIIVWIVWACISTKKQLKNELVHTNVRVLACSGSKIFSSSFEDIRNVSVEYSIWGRMFGYGNVHISSKNDSVTVHAIKEPEQWRIKLLKLSEGK